VDKLFLNPYVMAAFGATMAIGLLILGITLVLFKFLRKRIAEDILGMPAPGGPDSETWPYRNALGGKGVPIQCPWPCNEHKAMVDRVGDLDSELDTIEGRQKLLREEILPEKYPSRREYEACQRDRKAHEGELFNRVGALERKEGKAK
jgi:hypothetical protein